MTPEERQLVQDSVRAIEAIAQQLKDCEQLRMGNNPEASYGNLKAMANQFGRQLEGRIAVVRNILAR